MIYLFVLNDSLTSSRFTTRTEQLTYVPPTEGGGHIVFGADPVGVGWEGERVDYILVTLTTFSRLPAHEN